MRELFYRVKRMNRRVIRNLRVVMRIMRMSLMVSMWEWLKGAQVEVTVVVFTITRSVHTSRIGLTMALCKRLLRTNILRRPFFESWSGSERTLFDQQTMISASMERALKHNFDRQESWNRAYAYSHELEMNNRYEDDQARRLHADWHAGRPVVVDPPPVDYASLPPYDGGVSYPTPPLHHS
ncbi:hypothetical protein HanPI659440_Chr05g0194561 [Helianthus annuus]|nr:hypothetical protein HanPI659440_Chr05g0194561 [Helianthus annuus]